MVSLCTILKLNCEMGAGDSMYSDGLGTIFKSESEKCCCATRFYRMSQSTRRDQWTGYALITLERNALCFGVSLVDNVSLGFRVNLNITNTFVGL